MMVLWARPTSAITPAAKRRLSSDLMGKRRRSASPPCLRPAARTRPTPRATPSRSGLPCPARLAAINAGASCPARGWWWSRIPRPLTRPPRKIRTPSRPTLLDDTVRERAGALLKLRRLIESVPVTNCMLFRGAAAGRFFERD